VTLNLTVELCKESNLTEVQALCDELYSEDPNIADVRVDVGLTWNEFSEHPDKGLLLTIKDKEKVVGYCITIFFWSNEYSGDLIEIDELSISASHRGCGAGTLLFAWLRENYPSCKGFTLQVADKNERARNWYQKLGFTVSRNQHLIWVFK
jgi:ribosomal protein S18 acetylase RimI-like enzyme